MAGVKVFLMIVNLRHTALHAIPATYITASLRHQASQGSSVARGDIKVSDTVVLAC